MGCATIPRSDDRSASISARREQLLYLVVGAWNTFFGYAVWALMQYLLGDYLNYLVILVLAWPIAVLNAYIGYRYIVFRSRVRSSESCHASRSSTSGARREPGPAAHRPAGAAVQHLRRPGALLGVVVVCSYLGHKYFSFGGGRPDPAESDDRSEAHRE